VRELDRQEKLMFWMRYEKESSKWIKNIIIHMDINIDWTCLLLILNFLMLGEGSIDEDDADYLKQKRNY